MPEIKKVVLIGSGNVAASLATALLLKDFQILEVYSKHLNHAQKLAAKAGSKSTDNLNSLNKDADLYIIVLSDDVIAQIKDSLRLPGKIVVHTSGSVAM